MKDILSILAESGIELSQEQKVSIPRLVAENYKTVAEHDKKVKGLEAERNGYKEKLETANETLKTFEGIDAEDVKEKLARYDKKVKELEDSYKSEIYKRDYEDVLKRELETYKFSSDYAKSAVMAEIQAAELKMIDGKIIGLNDMLEQIKGKDSSAFIDKDTEAAKQNQARFTTPVKGCQQNNVSMSELMRMKNENPGLDITSYMKKGKE